MTLSRIYLSSPHITTQEIDYVHEAMQSNWIAPAGPFLDTFEKQIQLIVNQNSNSLKQVVALNSGTSAIHLALLLARVEKGDEVLCQSFTFTATANPIKYIGATPIFIDSEKITWNICPDLLEEAIRARLKYGKKPKAIVAVHTYGMPFQCERILAISKKYEIPLIEDSAEALGSSYNKIPCGSWGDFSIFSFNGNKIITTSAGGALICSSLEDKQKTLYLASQANHSTAHYEHHELGYNYRMSNICAAIGCGQLSNLDSILNSRKRIHQHYKDFFNLIKEVTVFEQPNSDYISNHWLNCITMGLGSKSNKTPIGLVLALEKQQIESRRLWKPLHQQILYKDCNYFGSSIAENLFQSGLCLPSSSSLTDNDLHRVTDTIYNYFNS